MGNEIGILLVEAGTAPLVAPLMEIGAAPGPGEVQRHLCTDISIHLFIMMDKTDPESPGVLLPPEPRA